MTTLVTTPPLRRDPQVGSIVRIPLADGFYAYGLIESSVRAWVYDFITQQPAFGADFFPTERLRHAVCYGELPAVFVNCARIKEDSVRALPKPQFYWVLDEDDKKQLGFKNNFGTVEGSGMYDSRELSLEEIQRLGLHRKVWLLWNTYEELIHEWRPQMEVRDVPEEFLDREAMRKMAAGEPVTEKPLPRQEVELVVIIPVQGDDPALDEPEEQFEEPLSEALEEAECGSCTSSGTTPDSFDIDVDTVKPSLRRCLSVIRRVLTKAGAPATTIIRQLPDDPNDPPIDHPLEAPPAAPKKAGKK